MAFERPGASSAVLSYCGDYRYELERDLSDPLFPNGRSCLFIMLNPSTADAEADDPTIRRCMGFARAWGFGFLHVGNLFAWRAKDQAEIRKVSDPVGPDNDRHLQWLLERVEDEDENAVICAWGAGGAYLDRDLAVLQLLADCAVEPQALRLTDGGFPEHPLYLAKDLRPTPYCTGRAALIGDPWVNA